jgi:hypothetical protein
LDAATLALKGKLPAGRCLNIIGTEGARDVMLGLMKTCRKLGVSFFEYLGCRLGVQGARPIPPLPDLVQAAIS